MPIASIHVPRQQRSHAARARPREETIERLIEHGWSGTTTTVVASRAGVSRGAQLHHYPTRAALVTAAMAHLAARRAAALPAGTQRLDRLINMLAAAFTGPLFVAALELWVAARTDPVLRAALVHPGAQQAAPSSACHLEAAKGHDNRRDVTPALLNEGPVPDGTGAASSCPPEQPARDHPP